jgi:hypothetical protein
METTLTSNEIDLKETKAYKDFLKWVESVKDRVENNRVDIGTSAVVNKFYYIRLKAIYPELTQLLTDFIYYAPINNVETKTILGFQGDTIYFSEPNESYKLALQEIFDMLKDYSVRSYFDNQLNKIKNILNKHNIILSDGNF